jgi:alkaline phosphatase D
MAVHSDQSRFGADDTDLPHLDVQGDAMRDFDVRRGHDDDRGDHDHDSDDHKPPLVYDATAFPDGVSSGDVTQTSAVLWARASKGGRIEFQVSTDPFFEHVVSTEYVAVGNSLVPAKVSVDRLRPDHRYYYRVVDASGHVGEGQFATAARPGDHEAFSFGVGGDTRGELGPYPSLKNAPAAGLDLFIKLGDTVYADQPSPAGGPAQTLQDFETKNNEIYSSHLGVNSWASLQATTPVLSMIDDGEVIGDFAGGAPTASDPRFSGPGNLINETPLYSNGLTAFEQYNAIANPTYSGTGDARFDGKPDLYRYNSYGADAALFMVDARSFRDAELPETSPIDTPQFLAESFDPTRTILGGVQLRQLEHDLLDAQSKGITWKFVNIGVAIQNYGPVLAADRFEGYAAERNELLKFINDNHIENVVFVSADTHFFSVNNLTYQDSFGGPQIATSAVEVDTMAVAAPLIVTQLPPLLTVAGLLPPDQLALYNQLPPTGKDEFLKQLVDKTFLAPLGYDPIGLDDNLPGADGKIHAELLQGSYFVSNDFGWTNFKVDPVRHDLVVTTYGIPAYTAADLATDPNGVLARTPTIVSQFRLTPTLDATIHGGEKLDPPDSFFANVTFAPGAKGSLQVDDASVGGQVSGFAPGDMLDFADVAFGGSTTIGYAPNAGNTGGTLSVTSSSHTANITLLGNYMASSFVAASDGHGGTLITDPPPSPSALLAPPHA